MVGGVHFLRLKRLLALFKIGKMLTHCRILLAELFGLSLDICKLVRVRRRSETQDGYC